MSIYTERVIKLKKWFTDARFGMFIHWGKYALTGNGEWAEFSGRDGGSPENFNPQHFDPDQWAELAWNAGMRYIVFTTKHHDGFCMFDSKYTDYKVTNTPFGKDVTRMVFDAFRKKGFRIGVYHSLIGWHHPHYLPDRNDPRGKNGETNFPNVIDGVYQKYLYDSVEQLMTEYGKIDILFWDYCTEWKRPEYFKPDELLAMIRKHQPDIIINDRMTVDRTTHHKYAGDYRTPECAVPNRAPSEMWEACASATSSWGYIKGDNTYKSAETVATALMGCVSKNGNLLLNFAPDGDGVIQENAVRTMKELAVWFQNNGEAVYGCHKSEIPAPDLYCLTQKGKYIYLYLPFVPIGHIMVPALRGRSSRAVLLRTGKECNVSMWGLDHAMPFECRIVPDRDVRPGDVIRIELDGTYFENDSDKDGSMK